ncbi:MAG: sigma-70 RNA polymerase sigma factor region 4 domain-containing protein, partial [Isosphaeraceae bacterium]
MTGMILSGVASERPVSPGDAKAIGLAVGEIQWPSLWARCWSRIGRWRVPPRWSAPDWREEARGEGALAACEALWAFEPDRLVPLEVFLYCRVVQRVWTRYRQEWSFGRRCRPDAALTDPPAVGSEHPDPDLLGMLASTLGSMSEAERSMIRQLLWGGRTEDQLAHELGITRQGVNRRKQ